MGFRHFGTLLIVFLIIMMVFGTERLREIGNDLAIAIRNFRKGLQDEPEENSIKKDKNTESNETKNIEEPFK